MILFDETENKYYEFMARMLAGGGRCKKQDIVERLYKELPGEPDFEVTEALFAADEGEGLIFTYDGGQIKAVVEEDFPIRLSLIEKQAAKTLVSNPYIQHFLTRATVDKLKKATEGIVKEWDPADITIKNLFSRGASGDGRSFENYISMIARAIKDRKAIRYDNIRPGRVEIFSAKAFPVKIEFSIVNDKFRICAYEPVERRFIKMNLDTMQNLEVTEETADIELREEYKEFLKINTKKVVLDVEPVDHVIERCFRVFSYYDRKARYDKEKNKYRLEISYLKADEKEVIKNILSMGPYVIVMEPRVIQKEVYGRIAEANKLYGANQAP